MIVFQDVTKQYGSSDPVLNSVNFAIEKGNFAYLIGPTGSGKTTIFRLIIRDLLPTEGKITLGEQEVTRLPKNKIAYLRRKVGVVFQDLKLLNDRTVTENVMLPLEFAGIRESEEMRRVSEILIEVGLSGKENMFPAQLSGGERQRVAIARALVFEPEVILADEPTGNLDTKTSFQILELLKNINKKGTTVFMATHNDKLIESRDRVIVLDKGHIAEDRKGNTRSEAKEENNDEHEEKKPAANLAKKEVKKAEEPKEKDEKAKEDHGKIKLASLAKK